MIVIASNSFFGDINEFILVKTELIYLKNIEQKMDCSKCYLGVAIILIFILGLDFLTQLG